LVKNTSFPGRALARAGAEWTTRLNLLHRLSGNCAKALGPAIR